LLWQSVDDLTRLEQLIQVSAEVKMPTTIAEVLHGQ